MKKLDKSFKKNTIITYTISVTVFLSIIAIALWLQGQQSVSISISNSADTAKITTTTELTYLRMGIILVIGLVAILAIANLVQRKQKKQIINEVMGLTEKIEKKDVEIITTNYSYHEFEVIKKAHNQKIASINEMGKKREEYFNMTVHDLRAPIQMLKNKANLLERYPDDKDLLKDLKLEINHLENEVSHYLILEKIDYFEKPHLQSVELNKFIADIISKYALSTNVQIISNVTDNRQRIDVSMFEKVVMNLVQNGLQYSNDCMVKIIINSNQIIFENNVNQYPGNIFCSERKRSKSGNGLGTLIIQKYIKLQELKLEEDNSIDTVRIRVEFI